MNWFRKFMMGRYGVDEFSFFLLIVMIVLSIVGVFVNASWIQILSFIMMIYCYFRIFSKNYQKRYQENQLYLRYFYPIRNKWNKAIHRIKDFPKYKYYTCPTCKQTLRVPRGKGKVDVTCPKCHTTFEKRT